MLHLTCNKNMIIYCTTIIHREYNLKMFVLKINMRTLHRYNSRKLNVFEYKPLYQIPLRSMSCNLKCTLLLKYIEINYFQKHQNHIEPSVHTIHQRLCVETVFVVLPDIDTLVVFLKRDTLYIFQMT